MMVRGGFAGRRPDWSRPALARQALVLGSLSLFIVAVYLAVAVGLRSVVGERWNTVLAVAATAIVALAFAPVRARAESLASRVVYGDRTTPYQALAEMSDRIGAVYATEDVLAEMARIVARGSGAAGARVWLRRGAELVPAAAWPGSGENSVDPVRLDGPDLPSLPEADHAVPVSDGNEVIGAITVAQPAGRPLSPAGLQLLADIAAQAVLVLRNARLTADLAASLEEISAQAAELHASRQRIVAAQDAERRQVERDIHDGAQQHLVALMVYLGLVRTLIERDLTKAVAMVPKLRIVVAGALETLHNLAQGVHPPLLRERGLAEALAGQATNPSVTVTVEAEGLGRYAPAAEAAVYFACLEALQNVSKHAPGSSAVVRLVADDTLLRFSVTDDGPGFDPERCRPGLGLANMADRLAALEGSLELRSSPGKGTTILGRLPSPAREPVA